MGASGTDPFSRGAGTTSDATLRVVQASDSPAPAGVSTAAKQDEQTALLTLLQALLTSIEDNTDGLEALIGTGNTSLASILAKLIAAPATEAKQDTGNTALASILAKIIAAPATEAKQDDGNASLVTIAAKDFATQTTLAAILAKIIAAPATEAKQPALGTVGTPSADVLSVQGFAYKTTLSFTRPENTTAYNAGDAVGIADVGTPANPGSAIHTFATSGPSGGSVVITSADIRIDLSAVPAGMTNFRLHLYDAAPDAILDNAAWDLSSAGDRGKYLGFIDLGSPSDLGSSLFSQVDGLNKQVKLAGGSTSIYGVLVTSGGYTPASATAVAVHLHTVAA